MASGVVVSFDPRKGFGFIRSRAFREDVFVHVADVEGRATLRPGQRVAFEAGPSDRGLRATRVVPGRAGLSPAWVGMGLLAGALVALTLGLHWIGLGYVGAYLASVAAVTWFAFDRDKRRAGLGVRRVPELVLLGLSLMGGTPAALLAMAVLRHKTRKVSFLAKFAGVVAVQVAAFVGWVAYRR